MRKSNVGKISRSHFTETIENNKPHFDHNIKPELVRTRNATKILELSDYPTDIINEARQVSTPLRTAKIMNEE